MASYGPRILLFGSAGAGKSSLLGALAQAASSQSAMLKGSLVQPSGELTDLHKNTYQANLQPTAALTSYAIQLQPADGGGPNTAATVLDSSGASANAMLQSKQPFLDSHPLKKPALDADTVLFIIDASMPGKQLVEEIQQFARWYWQFHETRGRRTEVGELPVYLVLHKCDLLAKPNESSSAWMQRIEEAKRKIDEKFREVLKKQGKQGTGFGSIQLRLWATAIKRPALADRPAKAQEPYGVAELFRQCLPSAADYAERRHLSQYRLHHLVIIMVAVVALLVLTVGFLAEYQPEQSSKLEEKVHAVLPKKDADRLRTSIERLNKKRVELLLIENDDTFDRLSDESQKKVKRYREELDLYLKKFEESQKQLKDPHLAKNEEEYNESRKNLQAFEDELKKSLAGLGLAEDQAKDWEEGKLGKRLQTLHKGFDRVDDETKKEVTWIREQIKLNDKVLDEGNVIYNKLLKKTKLDPQEAELWNLSFRERMNPERRLPRESHIPSTHMTYEDLDKFKAVKEAQKDWQDAKDELKNISDNIQRRVKANQ
jgi:GTPase SAR1 family protein